MQTTADLGLGAIYLGDNRCAFRVWAPRADRVDLHILTPNERIIPMTLAEQGYFHTLAEDIPPGSRYCYRLDDEKERPDPTSRMQPDGVHNGSEVVDSHYDWNDTGWAGLPFQQYIIYELHIGTFTPEGTFDAAIAHLDTLLDLGITAIEIMPVAHFPGHRNWGYDGVYLYAPHAAYGGPAGLKRLVDACHQRGIAVVLDVVYNHLGPEGNYLWDYGYYFTNRYQTPWGDAVNFDGPHSDHVRRFFLENALMWVDEYHIDALRLDAVHAIYDFSAHTFMEELADAIHRRAEQLGRHIYTIAESDQNDRRLLLSPAFGGYGLDAQWNDDLHHAIHTILTGERDGYYEDFGAFDQLVRIIQDGWLYQGDYSIHRQRRHGSSSRDISSGRLVVCIQNHDQVGNRMVGDRLSSLVSFDACKLAACTYILSPFIPMLFMGEEYGETAPFLYFVSHGDEHLIEAVRNGRKQEFSSFAWKGEPPDPQSEETFARSKLNHSLRNQSYHRILFDLYRKLIRLRKTQPALSTLKREQMDIQSFDQDNVIFIRRWASPGDSPRSTAIQQDSFQEGKAFVEGRDVVIILNFNTNQVSLELPFPPGYWRCLLNTSDNNWQVTETQFAFGDMPGFNCTEPATTLTLNPHTCIVYTRMEELY